MEKSLVIFAVFQRPLSGESNGNVDRVIIVVPLNAESNRNVGRNIIVVQLLAE